jgi:hypothetical protein
MNQTTHFFNLGYGWLCKHCSAENSERKQRHHSVQGLAFAKWVDEEHRCGLVCPRCRIDEFVNKPQNASKFSKGF